MTLRLPAFGRAFRDKRLKGWDPPVPVLVGVNLWLQRQWQKDCVLAVTADHAVLRLDFRMLAGCQVAVVARLADEPLARAIVQRIGQHGDPQRLELVLWDAGQLFDVIVPVPTREQLIRSGFSAAEAVALEQPTYHWADPHARRYWLHEAGIAARARAAADERTGLAA